MKVADAIKQQAALAAKIAKGDATAEERATFDRVNAALAAPADVASVVTQLDTMDKAAFEAHMQAEMAAMEKDANAARLAILKRNIDAVRRQAEAGRDVFAVEVPVIAKADPMGEMLARIADLEKKFDSRFVTGVGAPKAVAEEPAPAPEPEPAPAAVAEAPVEKGALDALVAALDETFAAFGVTVDAFVAKVAEGADLAAAAAELRAEIGKAAAKAKKPFPNAAPPFGPDGKPVDEEEAKKAAPPPSGDKAPAMSPEDDEMAGEEECKGCGKKKAKGAACPTCDKATKEDDDEAAAPSIAKWDRDLAAKLSPKDSTEAYRMLKGAKR